MIIRILVLISCTVNFVKNHAILIFNIQMMWQIHGSVRALAFIWGNYISKIFKSAKLRLRHLKANNAVKKIIGNAYYITDENQRLTWDNIQPYCIAVNNTHHCVSYKVKILVPNTRIIKKIICFEDYDDSLRSVVGS